jgi:glycosyltransferase involved in cell wall biosynthesis
MSKINILFMQSQSHAYADSMVHAILMRYLDRDQVVVHAACTAGSAGDKPASLSALETIPNLHLRPTNFGPSINQTSGKRQNMLSGSVSMPFNLLGLANYIRQNNIQLIHSSEKPRDAFYGYLLARATGAKFLIHLHIKVENWISPLTRWVMKRADALVGVSEFVAQSSIAMGYPAERTYHIHNGMDLAAWPATIDGSAIRSEFNVGPDMPLLVSVARLVYYKGQAELIQAAAKIREKVPAFKLLIVGEGNQDPDGYPAQMKNLVKELGLENQVLFTGFRRDVRQILAASDLFCLPSFEEPFGMVFVEAMAMKKAIAALDNGGPREIVQHGKSGLLSQPKDIDQLAENIVTLIQDPALRARMGAFGRQRVEEYFHAERMACDFEKLYRQIIGRE